MKSRKDRLKLRHKRIRKVLSGTAERPRLAVHFSSSHIYAQIIDDECGRTIASANTTQAALRQNARSNVSTASVVGAEIAKVAIEKSVKCVVFDRGGFRFHGKVKALADAARQGGLDF